MLDRASPSFRSAHARGQDWMRVVGACIAQLEPQPAGANLGFVYLGRGLAGFADDILTALRRSTGVTLWVGASGQQALGGGGADDAGGLAVMVARLPERSFRLLDPGRGLTVLQGGSAAVLHAEFGAGARPHRLVELRNQTDAFLIGPTSAPGGSLPQIAGGVGEGGISGVVFGSALAVLPMTARGIVPLGPPARVTSRVGQEIFRLDGRPAFEVVMDRLGDIARARPDRALEEILVGTPPAHGGTARAVARIAGFERGKGSLRCEGAELAGPQVALFRRDTRTAELELRAMLADLRTRLEGRPPRAVLYFTAASRLARLTAAGLAEVELVADALGRPPLVGLASDAVIVDDRVEVHASVAAILL